jgi:hypothetical protein
MVTDQVYHPYKTRGKIMFLYIFNVHVFRLQTRRQKFGKWLAEIITRIQFGLPSSNFRLSI